MTALLNFRDGQPMREAPNNIEAEQCLLGAILVNNAAFDRVSSILEPGHFFEPLHRRIYELSGQAISAGKGVNPVTIKSYLPPDAKVGDKTLLQYLAALAKEAVTVVQARDYAAAVHDAWLAREALSVAQDAVETLQTIDPGRDILDQLTPIEESISRLRAERIKTGGQIGLGKRYLDAMDAANQRGRVDGVPICLREIEDVISEPCFEAGNLYGLLSSSGEGKTSLTVQMIRHAMEQGHPTLMLSYDQSGEQIVRQMVAQRHGIENRRQRNPRELLSEKEWELIVDFGTWIDRQPFDVIKCTDHGAAQLVGMARAFVKRHGNGKVPFIVVDHIGSVKPEDRRADEGTKAKDINKVFKAGAEQTGAAWLVLNQRNSYGMRRDNPRPISADLFGGDPAKQAYDAILYLYRQEKFKAERVATAASDSDWKKINKVFGSEIEGLAEIGAIKVRFGNPFIKRELRFEDRFTRYRPEHPESELLQQEGMF